MKNKFMRLLQRTLRRLNAVKEKITGIILFKRKKELLEEIQNLKNLISGKNKAYQKTIEKIHIEHADRTAELLKIQNDIKIERFPHKQEFGIRARVDPYMMNQLNNYAGYKEYFVDNICNRLKRFLMNANFYKI